MYREIIYSPLAETLAPSLPALIPRPRRFRALLLQPIVGLFANGGIHHTPREDATAVTDQRDPTGQREQSGSQSISSRHPTPPEPSARRTAARVYASGGGTIGVTDAAGVSTKPSPAVYALGAGSTITLTLLPPTSPALATIVTAGDDSAGVLASSGGSVVLSGGSVMTSGTAPRGWTPSPAQFRRRERRLRRRAAPTPSGINPPRLRSTARVRPLR